ATFNSTEKYYIYGNSQGFLAGYPTTRHALSCVMIAQDAQGMQRDYQYTIHRNPSLLKHAKIIGSEAAQRALDRLSSQRVPTQTIPVIFRADVATSLFSHFCSAIAGSKLYRKASFLLDSLNTQLFPKNLEILEEPHLQQALGSAPFDADGVQTRSRYLIKEGILQGYILSAYSARKLNMANTGNAGGIHNLIVSHQDITLKDLIHSQKKALFVTELMGQGINLVTGNYSRGAAGFMIEDGEIKYPVHEITIAGNLKDMFKQMSAISNDVDRRGNIQTGSVLIESMMLAGS
ncbi:MAG TPA: metallopeptidase TldD-related protein, partial [Gammaproteobacteria bacterium]|nr:metallopeptidase TldD-related protein [Gammaproteobacteria bacterium]